MKKSDAVKLVEKTLINLKGICGPKITAETIISDLANAGMLPPLYIKKIKTLEYEAFEPSNEWEKE